MSTATAFPPRSRRSFQISEKLINATVGGELVSSLLAVCCVTVAFCSNLLMISDRVNGAAKDLAITPVRPSAVALGYFISTVLSTLAILHDGARRHRSSIFRTWAGICRLRMSFCLILDVILLVLFGTALSSVVTYPLTTSGQGSAVGTVVSAGYGFICGAYMPISSFGSGLQRVISFLPGTYGTPFSEIIRSAEPSPR